MDNADCYLRQGDNWPGPIGLHPMWCSMAIVPPIGPSTEPGNGACSLLSTQDLAFGNNPILSSSVCLLSLAGQIVQPQPSFYLVNHGLNPWVIMHTQCQPYAGGNALSPSRGTNCTSRHVPEAMYGLHGEATGLFAICGLWHGSSVDKFGGSSINPSKDFYAIYPPLGVCKSLG